MLTYPPRNLEATSSAIAAAVAAAVAAVNATIDDLTASDIDYLPTTVNSAIDVQSAVENTDEYARPSELDLGSISGVNAINWILENQIQTCVLTGDTEFTLGTGWPIGHGATVVLQIDNTVDAAVTWTIVTADRWVCAAPTGAGTYLITFMWVNDEMWASGIKGIAGV